MSELTFVTPSVSRASAMARPIWAADCAVPFRVTSPLCACTSRLSKDSSLSACSLFFTMVTTTESSIEPVGAPAGSSRVRTIVVEWSRSDWMSAGARRHSLIRAEASCVLLLFEATAVVLVLAEPVALVEAVPEAWPAGLFWSLLATAPLVDDVALAALLSSAAVEEVEAVSLLAIAPLVEDVLVVSAGEALDVELAAFCDDASLLATALVELVLFVAEALDGLVEFVSLLAIALLESVVEDVAELVAGEVLAVPF